MKTMQVREKFMGRARTAWVSLAAATCAAFTASAATLTHRWSFNGTTDAENLTDSIDSSITATKYTSAYSWDGTNLLMRGNGSEGSKGISLGSNLIDTSAATLEIWATQRAVCSWNAIFEYAVDTSNNVRWRFNRGITNTRQSLGAPGVSAEEYFRHTLDEPAHFSVTFSTVGNVTTVRWMRRNAKTGAIEYEYSGTMSNALADFNNPQLLIGGTMWNDKTSNADFDEVRIWNGVLSDAQLTANVLAGPDTPLGGGTTRVEIPANVTFTIPTTGGYGFKTDQTATIGEGAKIRFDTTGYFGRGLRFKTGGIAIPSGSVLDYVELSDTVNYVAAMEDANTILVRLKDAVPYTSTWIGSSPSTAADLSNPANWASTNVVGVEVSAAPTPATTVIIPADKLGIFSPPADASVNWGRLFFGGRTTATRYGHKAGAPDSLHNAWRNLALTSYTNIGAVPNGANDISYFTGATGGPNTPTELSVSQIRLEGWFYVTAAQAGWWSMPSHFDDALTFAIDGEWVLLNSTYLFTNGAGAFVSEGWHRFALVAADTSGGWGSNYKFANGVYVPFVVSINGGAAMTFSADNFTFGSDEITVTLSDDLDWRALGTPMLSNAVTIDLNGHNLIIHDMDTDAFGAKIVNTAATVSTIYVTVEDSDNARVVTSGLASGVQVLALGSSTATWTGAAGDGDAINPANWIVKKGTGEVMQDVIPDSSMPVTIAGENVNMTNNVDKLRCASFTIGTCTFTADCDWRGLVLPSVVKPQIIGTVDLNGHTFKLNRLKALFGGAFENSDDGISEVRFEASGNATESDFIENSANLRTAANARIVIIPPAEGFTTEGDINVGNNGLHVAFVQNGGDINIANTKLGGYVSGTSGYGYYVMNGGTLSAGEVAASGYGNGEFLQTGGDVVARVWFNVGRYGGRGVYKMTGGTLTAMSDGANNHFALLGATGGTGVFDIGGDAVAIFAGAGHYLSCGSSFGNGSNHGEIYVRDNASLTVEGAYGDRAIALGTNAGANNSGKMVQTGGTIRTLTNRIAVGCGGTGEYTISGGTAICGEVRVAENSGVVGTLAMNGGTIVANRIAGGSGNSTVIANGGTFKAAADDAAIFVDVLSLVYGAGGLVVDTDGHTATLADNLNFTTEPGSKLVKDGEGTLTVPALPPVDTVRVKKGILQLEGIAAVGDTETPATSALAHRWSFAGNLTDSVTADTSAEVLGENSAAFTYRDGKAVLPGGANKTCYINLGANKIPSTAMTIEFWFTPHYLQTWNHVFTFCDGSTTQCLPFCARRDTGFCSFDTAVRFLSTSPLVDDTTYHIALSFEPVGENRTTISVYARAAGSDAYFWTEKLTVDNWTLSNVRQEQFWLGSSPWTSNPDITADYDEVRIWEGALSEDAVALSYAKGADATADDIAAIVAKNAENTDHEVVFQTLDLAGGMLNLGGNAFSWANLMGNGGSVRNGTLEITDKVRLHVGDCITASGTIDLSHAKVEIIDVENIRHFTFIKPAEYAQLHIVGVPELVNAPIGWSVAVTFKGAKITKSGYAIFLR